MKTKTDCMKLARALHHKGKLKFYSIQAFKDLVAKYETLEHANSSSHEQVIYDKLLKSKCRQIRTQVAMVEYTDRGKKHKYVPDFVILDKHGHIALIEIKDYASMAERVVLKKYVATQKYCKKHGFKYGLMTKSFISYEQIAKAKYNQKIYQYMKKIIDERARFTYRDYMNLKLDLKLTHNILHKEITKICIQNDWMLKNSMIHQPKSLVIKKHNLHH